MHLWNHNRLIRLNNFVDRLLEKIEATVGHPVANDLLNLYRQLELRRPRRHLCFQTRSTSVALSFPLFLSMPIA